MSEPTNYQPTLESLSKHRVPEWFHDAKFGIFIHWGLYSVPGYAVTKTESNRGVPGHRYAEWYLYSLKSGQPRTVKYHAEKYGTDMDYYDFKTEFNAELNKWDPDAMADLFGKSGAKYVVLVTKHHDGLCLWPTDHPNPKRDKLYTDRDVVHELAQSVRKNQMKFGTYYSSLLDWGYHPLPAVKKRKRTIAQQIEYTMWNYNRYPEEDNVDAILRGEDDPEYTKYCEAHWRELIEKVKPELLWSDIGYPPTARLEQLMADYLNAVPDGIIDNRWGQRETVEEYCENVLKNPKARLRKRFLSKKRRRRNQPVYHYDFVTPEYRPVKKMKKEKWESCRGLGYSFGINFWETDADYMSFEELVHLFTDIISKNGNLLLNVGPNPDGTIHPIQTQRLLEFGTWMDINGEAVYGTRPWIKAEGRTLDRKEIRYTCKENKIYLHILRSLNGSSVQIDLTKEKLIAYGGCVRILGMEREIQSEITDGILNINFPTPIPTKLSEMPSYTIVVEK